MKSDTMIWLLVAVAGVLLLSSFAGVSANAAYNLAALDPGTYGTDNIQRLINLYNAILQGSDPNTGQPLTANQQGYMLAQALHESGLFRDSFNENNIDNLNNWTGIKWNSNSKYQPGPGSVYVQYPDLNSYVTDWLRVLNRKNQPIEATSLQDYANRLKLNGYYTDTLANYYNDLVNRYNLIAPTLIYQTS